MTSPLLRPVVPALVGFSRAAGGGGKGKKAKRPRPEAQKKRRGSSKKGSQGLHIPVINVNML